MISARHQQPQRSGARLCRTQRHQCPDTGQCGGHHQNRHDTHLPVFQGRAPALQNDTPGTRRIELQCLSRRERTGAGHCHRSHGTRLHDASALGSGLRLGQKLAGGALSPSGPAPPYIKITCCRQNPGGTPRWFPGGPKPIPSVNGSRA